METRRIFFRHLAKLIQNKLGGGVPRELADSVKAAFLVKHGGLRLEQFRDGFRESLRVLWVNLDGSVFYDFGKGSGGAGDNRAAAGHGFEGRDSKAFVKRGEDEHFRAGVEFVELIHGDVAQKVDAVLERGGNGFVNL